MKRTDFQYELPSELIAQAPLPERSASRLLCFDRQTGGLEDRNFNQLPDLLKHGDLLVFNNTRVIPARLFAKKSSGGQIEILLERLLGQQECLVHHSSKKGIRNLMPRHIQNRDSGLMLASLKPGCNIRPAIGEGLLNPRIKVVAMVEIDIHDMVAPDDAIQRDRLSIDIKPRQLRNFTRSRSDMSRNFLKIIELST